MLVLPSTDTPLSAMARSMALADTGSRPRWQA
jgi:hypothetical protein